MNRLIMIGYMGQWRCYLNIARDEAERRYRAAEYWDEYLTQVKEFAFDDEFGAYEVWQ